MVASAACVEQGQGLETSYGSEDGCAGSKGATEIYSLSDKAVAKISLICSLSPRPRNAPWGSPLHYSASPSMPSDPHTPAALYYSLLTHAQATTLHAPGGQSQSQSSSVLSTCPQSSARYAHFICMLWSTAHVGANRHMYLVSRSLSVSQVENGLGVHVTYFLTSRVLQLILKPLQ